MKLKQNQNWLFTLALIIFSFNTIQGQVQNDLNTANCECSTEKDRSKRYIPPLNILLKFNEFVKATTWHLEHGETDFNKLYFSNMHSNSSSYSGNQLSMIIFSSQPIKLTHPKNAFTINITPCNNANNYYDVETYYGENIPIDYNFKAFNYSAESYFDVMRVIRNYYNTEEALKAFWLRKFEYDAESLLTLINKLNTDYNLKINPELSVDDYEGFIDNLEEKITEILEKLSNNEDLHNFALKEYILTDASQHKINAEEEKNIKSFFYDYRSKKFSKLWIDENYLRGKYSGYFVTKNIGFEVNSNIIHTEQYSSKTSLFLGVNNVKYSNTGSLKIKTKDVCDTLYKIANTNIKITFKSVTIIALSNEEIAKNNARNTTNFSGLLIHDASLLIPLKEKQITAIGNNLRLNNNAISGSFDILKTETNLSIALLENQLTTLGLNAVKITENETVLTVSFNNKVQK